MKRKYVIAAFTATVVTAAGLTGCSAGESTGGDGTDGPVTITILESKQTNIDAISKEIPGFEAAMKEQGKDITVELIPDLLTDEQLKTKLTQQLIAGQAPDVLDIGENMAIAWSSAGYLAPLDEYLEDWDGWSHYYPAVKEAMTRQDGQIYSLPSGAGVLNLFYRKDILEQVGVDTSQPETWDDLIGRLEQVKEATGDTPIVIPAGTAWGGGTWGEGFQPLLGGTDTGYYDSETATWDLESPGWLAVFELYADLVEKGLMPVQDLQNPNPWEPTKYVKFPEGDIQVAAQGTWGWKFDWGPDGATPIEGLTEKVSTWQWPGLRDGDEPYGWSSTGGGYAISEDSEHKEAAFEFIKYLSSGKPLAEQLVASGAASARDDLDDVAPYSGEPQLLQAGEDLSNSVFVVTGDGADQISQAVATATELILSGSADGQQAYEAFVKDATELLGPSLVKE
ncbi:ABC transporter substrate-binding protein [Microbacterium thalli]|uniref:Extracellular solute-binding protein n=1 Tax=Microbacterium thalli TaxID=3027921 RepID=A0ABT5SDR6_9MICO|nr:extracellular solute-binding protein [Microbacterium thalli]MDD7928326.1 extracellular solute-binding protein [Microbacterium thalli]MDD7960909.1 extracellular solute-binding protein [Microbacterium thalli]MDN8548861.1 extracellular solute-binding protein [Microbacterium thalli]